MPIFEFKCTQCNEFFEVLVRNQDEESEIRCPQCKSEQFERVISTTSHVMGDSGGKSPQATTRNCASGSCTTYTIPGHGS